jgi:hypothetical protein
VRKFSLFILTIVSAAPLRAEEQLSMPQFPAGWVEAFSRPGQQELVEYVPTDQSAASWQKKITLEIYRDQKNLPLDILQRRAAQRNRENCEGVVEGKFQSGVNNGFASAFWTLGCERDRLTGFGETRYTKAIQGAGALYLLTYAWRTMAYGPRGPGLTPQEVDTAMSFLASSVVCDESVAKSLCPKS